MEEVLPPELVLLILQHAVSLERDYYRTSLVCKKWHRMVSSSRFIWFTLFKHRWPEALKKVEDDIIELDEESDKNMFYEAPAPLEQLSADYLNWVRTVLTVKLAKVKKWDWKEFYFARHHWEVDQKVKARKQKIEAVKKRAKAVFKVGVLGWGVLMMFLFPPAVVLTGYLSDPAAAVGYRESSYFLPYIVQPLFGQDFLASLSDPATPVSTHLALMTFYVFLYGLVPWTFGGIMFGFAMTMGRRY